MFSDSKFLFGLACVFGMHDSHAALTWPGCSDPTAADFQVTSLATASKHSVKEPMKMAFDLLAAPGEDAKGKVDIYFTERMGKVRKVDGRTGNVINLATLPLQIDAASSDGVLGIALDPNFKTNHLLYIYYTFVSATEKSWRVSRFALNADHTSLDLASEIPVLKIPILSGSKHPGGDIQFDAYGDLWISTGNDAQLYDYPLYSSPNTNDLRGKILRIHPKPDGTYSIPSGNLFAPGTERTKPEIYIMGTRNAYTLALDPVRRWVMWGDVGPDLLNFDGGAMNGNGATEKTEEYDLATAPGNYGYPFFSGDFATKPGTNANAPTIPAGYTWEGSQPGLTTLPKAIPPIYPYKKACAVTGPLYRYDGDLNSSVKFPPHFQRKWLVTDFNGDNNKVTAFTLNDAGTTILSQEQVLGSIPLHGPLDLKFGPDGALYVVNYAGYRSVTQTTGLVRIDYVGACRPAEPKLEVPSSTALAGGGPNQAGARVEFLRGRSLAVSVAVSGRVELEVHDLRGQRLLGKTSFGSTPISLAEIQRAGAYLLRVQTSHGENWIRFAKD
jgi:glucose/arabinose dehydrogenase